MGAFWFHHSGTLADWIRSGRWCFRFRGHNAKTYFRASSRGSRSMASNTSHSTSGPEFDAQDRDLIERVAARVVELRMELPALLTLESGRPLSLLASQTLYFFEPVVTALLRLPEYRRFARLIERRETIELLMEAIEKRAEVAQQERRAAAKAGKASANKAATQRRP
jgi:hypothetical protein